MPAPNCADELQRVYDAIMALATGKQTTSVSFGDRSVSYSQTQLKDLKLIYAAFYADCGAEAGLPDLASVERGPPAIARFA